MTTGQENLSEFERLNDLVISKEAAQKRLKGIENWSLQENTIVRGYTFKNFLEAMSFVQEVAALAEEAKHHPDIFISYNKVELTLTTHKSGGLTAKDFALAYKINKLA